MNDLTDMERTVKSPVKRLAVVAAIVLSLSACTSGTAETEADVPAEDSNLSMAEAAEAKSSQPAAPNLWEDDAPYDPDTDPYVRKAEDPDAEYEFLHKTFWAWRDDSGKEFWCDMWETTPNDVLESMLNGPANDPDVATEFMNDNCE